jgi:hypothetical protein
MMMRNMMADSGINEWNGNTLAVLGQMSFIEQLKVEMKSMKEEYDDTRIAVTDQLNKIGRKFNQMIPSMLSSLGDTFQKFNNQWVLVMQAEVNSVIAHNGNSLSEIK